MPVTVSIQLDPEDRQPLYLQLADRLREMIESGQLEEHSKLPPIRNMARQLGVNNGTVVSAYRKLEIEHLAYSKTGSGTYVASRKLFTTAEEQPSYLLDLPRQTPGESPKTDYTGVSPEPVFFPVQTYRQLVDRILERDGGYAFDCPDSQGYLPLRETLSGWLKRRNIQALPEHIHITSGSQQALDIITKTLVHPNDVVAVESPLYPGALAAFSARGARIMEIPLQADGLDLNRLEERVRRTRISFLYTMPCFQNPTGITWSLRKKQQLLTIAEKYGFYILEDDFVSEFSYGRKNLQTLKELDTTGRVIYVKSIAKLVMPGLRLGFLLTPPELNQKIRTVKFLSDISTSGLSQRVVDLYLRGNQWETEFKDMVRSFRIRYNLMTEQMDSHFPKEITYIPPQGGFCFWLSLPEGRSSSLLAQRALEQNIILQPGNSFFLNQRPSKYFRLGFGKVENEEIRSSIPVLGDILRKIL